MQTHTSIGPARGLTTNVVDYLMEDRLKPGEADRPYLVGPSGDHTFGDVHHRACQVGNLLRSLGIGPGDRVLFSVMDGIDFVALFLGAMKIGAVSLPLNTFLNAKDYAYYIRDSAARAVIVDASLAGFMTEVGNDLPAHVFVANGEVAGYAPWEDAVQGQPGQLESVARAPGDAAFWLYSSGSTGDPKGVPHTHEHIYWACELFGLGQQGMALRRDDVIHCPPKMFFAYGLGNQVYFPLRAGAQVLVESAPIKPAAILQRMVQARPTVMMSVPTLYAGLLELMHGMPPADVRDACKNLRLCVSGGELLPPALYRRWLEVTGCEILDGVGTTEMTHMFLFNRPGEAVPGSCGQLIPGYEARLLDDELNDVPEGEVGNLYVRGPTAAGQYWNKPQKTQDTMWDGGVLTGDKSYRDASGHYFHVGRVDDMLRVGGIWVSPTEVEAAIAEHPAVLECAVIGRPDEREMVKPHAYVVLKAGHDASADLAADLNGFVRSRLAHIKCPRQIDFIAGLPKTATGKIQRFQLRARQPGSAS